MTTLLVRRLAAAVVILIALTAVVFVLQHVAPLDPVRAELGSQASAAAVAARRHELGLDTSPLVQFCHYFTGLLHGDYAEVCVKPRICGDRLCRWRLLVDSSA